MSTFSKHIGLSFQHLDLLATKINEASGGASGGEQNQSGNGKRAFLQTAHHLRTYHAGSAYHNRYDFSVAATSEFFFKS